MQGPRLFSSLKDLTVPTVNQDLPGFTLKYVQSVHFEPPAVIHCRKGLRACHELLLLRAV